MNNENFNESNLDESLEETSHILQENTFEDISSSSESEEATYSLFDFGKNGNYEKKPHGFWAKFRCWWKNRKTWQKSVMITATSIFLIFAILIGVASVIFDYNYDKLDKDALGIESVIDKNVVNIALFGIDTRNTNSFEGNSDSIMILSINTVSNKVKIISVMRDTLTPITDDGKTAYKKINSAYATGGPELAIKTLNTIFKLDISAYAAVNFYGMADIIDAVGGIDAELTSNEVLSYSASSYAINGCIKEICDNMKLNAKDYYITTPGKHHLNGVQAVAYSRIRYGENIWGTNNDYGRTDRQRYVMEQLFNKAVALEKKQYKGLVDSLIPCSITSLKALDILDLAFSVLLDSPTFEQTRIPQTEFLMTSPVTSAGSVVYYDLDYASKVIHGFIYDDIPLEKYVEENGIEKNDWYSKVNGGGHGGSTKPSTPSEQPYVSENDTTQTPSQTEPLPNTNATSSQNSSVDQGAESTQSGSDSSSSVDSQSSTSTSSEETDSKEHTSSGDTVSKDDTSSKENESGNTTTSDKNSGTSSTGSETSGSTSSDKENSKLPENDSENNNESKVESEEKPAESENTGSNVTSDKDPVVSDSESESQPTQSTPDESNTEG